MCVVGVLDARRVWQGTAGAADGLPPRGRVRTFAPASRAPVALPRGAPDLPMLRLAPALVLLGLLLTGCAPDAPPPEPGPAEVPVDLDDLTITVSGRAQLLPEAAALAAEAAPSVGGLTASVEEPLRVGVNDPEAVFGEGTLSPEGAFRIEVPHVGRMHTTLAVGLPASSERRLLRASTVVYDTAFTGSRPRTDVVDAHAWAITEDLEDALTRIITPERILARTDGRAQRLRDAGFIVGRVVDGEGKPVQGAVVLPDNPKLAWRIFYPRYDLSDADLGQTGTSGLFVYVHDAAEPLSLTLTVEGVPNPTPQHAAALKGQALVLELRRP